MRFIIPLPTKLRRDIVTLPSVHHILVNTLGSTSFNGFWPILVHTQSLGESETLWFSRSKVNVTGSNFYRVTSLWTLESTCFNGFWPNLVHTVQLKRKTQSPCLIKDYRNAELTRSLCVYVDGPRNNMDMTDRTRCFHESITDCNYWNVHS